MEAAMPDDHRPVVRNAVDPFAVHLTMPDWMVAPAEQRLIRIAHRIFDLPQPVNEGVLTAHRSHVLPG